jgi:protein TonB
VRLILSSIAGIAMALVLFLIMSSLISGNNDTRRDPNERLNLDFILLDLDEVENIRRRVPPPEPEEVVQLPTLPRLILSPQDKDLQTMTMPRLDIQGFGVSNVELGSPLEYSRFGGELQFGGFIEEGDLYAILRVEPVYPPPATIRKISGWVDLEYTVLPNGSVTDIVVLRSSPSSVFEESAVNAISKWRFKPRVINGQPVPARVEQRHNFNFLR